jgi:hypothetical protein
MFLSPACIYRIRGRGSKDSGDSIPERKSPRHLRIKHASNKPQREASAVHPDGRCQVGGEGVPPNDSGPEFGFQGISWYRLWIFQLEEKVNRKEIEQRIWGKTIASARTIGLISEQEAQFLIEEYLRDFRSKNGWDGKTYIIPRIF